MNPLDLATVNAYGLLNIPYIWGAMHPLIGMDCSGFVQWVLSRDGVGIMDVKPKICAAEIYEKFQPVVTNVLEGTLVFYGAHGVEHVMYCLDDRFCIGASNGNNQCRTITDSRSHNAYVKVRAINYRSDILGYCDPFKNLRGV